ncbi:hypothetical protein TIFTF001_037975 [Ficus carica]|uniref:Disease resistance protein At4g27190-like leucine-rich repeats domain-containing protein n=1 Tax=Ficus carica TaxID=3494 RepID=A0AA88E780_FICCA|nr:hypothetical protein TIFTF001_037975 [Ficus carica]
MYCLRENVRFEDCFMNRENFKDLYVISVPGSGGINDQLPERLACPRLNGEQLASSFRSLQNLKALHLEIFNGEDIDVAIIGELKNLVILDLSYSSGLLRLPKEMVVLYQKACSIRIWKVYPWCYPSIIEVDASCFQDLERLQLYELENLESFMLTSPPTTSVERPTLFDDKVVFNNLQELTITWCHNLRSVWTLATLATFESLQQLNKLSIFGCMLMEEVLVFTNEAGDHEETKLKKILLPKLESLELNFLRKLERFGFCQADDYYTIEFPSLSKPSIGDCPELRTFIVKSTPSSRTTVEEVKETEMAQAILSSEKLKKLIIENCHLIQDVLVVTKEAGDDEKESKKISFPNLEYLSLQNLPKLERTFIAKSTPLTSTAVDKVEERRRPEKFCSIQSKFDQMQ